MKHNIITLVVVAIAFCSCSTYHYTSREAFINNHNIEATPTVVDVRVDYKKRITVTSSECKTLDEALNEARYNALIDNNIDVLVDMVYKVIQTGRRYKAIVTGFAGYYTNSRTFYEDIKLLQNVTMEDVEKYLILHNPEVIKYINDKGEVVNIYHNENPSK